LVIVVVTLSVAVFGATETSLFDTASNVIREHVKSYPPSSASRPSGVAQCTITAGNNCAITELATTGSTFVYPGGNTRCIFDTSTPYAFQVWRGAKDKVIVYFQGGGACWDKASTDAGFCTTDSSLQSEDGIFNRANANNKFKDYTIVHLSYCSGDVWGGNTTRPYKTFKGSSVVQVGQFNGQATLNWILQQQQSGGLASTLSELLVMGCSAGSIGAQLWGNAIISQLSAISSAIVPDSYAGVFPENSQGPLVKGYGLCSWKYLPASLKQQCDLGVLTIQDINMVNMASMPNVPMSFIQSKTDIVQQSFYVAIGVTTPGSAAEITPEQFYADVSTIFGGYNKNPNFMTYLVNGDQHCYTPLPLYYTADGLSSVDNNGPNNVGPPMDLWTQAFPLTSGKTQSTLCEGASQTQTQAQTPSNQSGAVNDQTYCATTVSPKSFTSA